LKERILREGSPSFLEENSSQKVLLLSAFLSFIGKLPFLVQRLPGGKAVPFQDLFPHREDSGIKRVERLRDLASGFHQNFSGDFLISRPPPVSI